MRLAYFGDAGGFVETAIYERADLEYGHSVVGPVIVEQADSTTLCPPGLSNSGGSVLEPCHRTVDVAVVASHNEGRQAMAISDWNEWHQEYDEPGSELAERLRLVQKRVATVVDACPSGTVTVVSICAGQGESSSHPWSTTHELLT